MDLLKAYGLGYALGNFVDRIRPVLSTALVFGRAPSARNAAGDD
jgi:hypothetical protein